MPARHVYKVLFVNQGKVYEIYARSVSQGELFGFLEVEELVFGERTSLVVDPGEERIRAEFEGVRRTYIPLHAVLRVDEVAKQGISKISAAEGGNVAQFPLAGYAPGGDNLKGK
ncbi:DUF1820 family protein [Wenzhouxiangella sp. XN24]|uniref:DUF1820 family protein n=1 Tax=Wenzhouxiangella sp. XN24 TaxID=2713569 RepID=UPI0013EB5888|nr:DUF1820 family protein [Wenzhouxiangella sp. XN24]NGX16902.1 DUF1820 family protein [Wenzhouxiangella sp. XN24]